jgi:hypothetical protein
MPAAGGRAEHRLEPEAAAAPRAVHALRAPAVRPGPPARRASPDAGGAAGSWTRSVGSGLRVTAARCPGGTAASTPRRPGTYSTATSCPPAGRSTPRRNSRPPAASPAAGRHRVARRRVPHGLVHERGAAGVPLVVRQVVVDAAGRQCLPVPVGHVHHRVLRHLHELLHCRVPALGSFPVTRCQQQRRQHRSLLRSIVMLPRFQGHLTGNAHAVCWHCAGTCSNPTGPARDPPSGGPPVASAVFFPARKHGVANEPNRTGHGNRSEPPLLGDR